MLAAEREQPGASSRAAAEWKVAAERLQLSVSSRLPAGLAYLSELGTKAAKALAGQLPAGLTHLSELAAKAAKALAGQLPAGFTHLDLAAPPRHCHNPVD